MIRYSLVTTCDDLSVLRETLEAYGRRVSPAPRTVAVINDGSRARGSTIAEAVADELRTPSAINVLGNRRARRGRTFAFGRAWDAAGALPEGQWAMIVPQGFRFLRSLFLTDAAHVLAMEPQVAQMAFLDGDPVDGAGFEARGSAIRWLERDEGFLVGPCLIRTSVARAFPWPTHGFSDAAYDLEVGMRSSVPGTTFAAWGNGTRWVERLA